MGEASSAKGPPREDAEPYLDLVQPRGMGGRVVEVDVLVACQPPIVLGLVGVEVVEDHMDLAVAAVGNHLVHELKELATSPALEVPGPHLAGGHLQGGEECGRAVAFVVMAVASERLAVGKPEPALGPFQGLRSEE